MTFLAFLINFTSGIWEGKSLLRPPSPGADIWGGGEWGLPPPSPKSAISPPQQIGVGRRRKALPAPKASEESWRFFHLEDKVYLVKVAFAVENLEKFSPPAEYFFVQHL